MDKRLVKANFTRFKNRCDAHERDQSWPSGFARALSLALVDRGYGPAELARRSGILGISINGWLGGKHLPRKKNAEHMESVLDLRPGTFTEHAQELTQELSARSKRMWDKRRRKAGTLGRRRELQRAGKYTNGADPLEAAFRARARKVRKKDLSSSKTLQGRVRQALHGVIRSSNGDFVVCVSCRKPLYRRFSDRGPDWETVWHGSCWRENLRITSTADRPRPPVKRGPSSVAPRVRAALMSDGLGMTYGQIAAVEIGHSELSEEAAIEQRVRRGRLELVGMLWGHLFPLGKRPPDNIHGILRHYSVGEALQIARGDHPLSGATDIAHVERWSPKEQRVGALEFLEIADAPLAQALGNAIKDRFKSVTAAANHIGVNHSVLVKILLDRQYYLTGTTWPPLSELTGLSEDELRGLAAKSGRRLVRRKRIDVA